MQKPSATTIHNSKQFSKNNQEGWLHHWQVGSKCHSHSYDCLERNVLSQGLIYCMSSELRVYLFLMNSTVVRSSTLYHKHELLGIFICKTSTTIIGKWQCITMCDTSNSTIACLVLICHLRSVAASHNHCSQKQIEGYQWGPFHIPCWVVTQGFSLRS